MNVIKPVNMALRFDILLQHLIPKLALTVLAGKLGSLKAGKLTTSVIRWYITRYTVNMTEAANSDITSYKTFKEFFTRPLKPDARPLAPVDFVCPVDGSINQFGTIESGKILQAKDHSYSVTTLVGGDQELATQFEGGEFATLYLSPGDYHRVHMPYDGRLVRMIYIPGSLFSVNPTTANRIPGLFACNERVVCVFNSLFGPFVLILIGATIVGSIATAWHGVVNSQRSKVVRDWHYDDDTGVNLKRGEEMGYFSLGSTVAVLFPKNTLTFNPDWANNKPILMGEFMGISVQ